MADEQFPKANRIRTQEEFRRLYQKARRRDTGALRVLVLPNQFARIRLGLSVSRKVGNAVKRNRVKRRLREIVRKRQSAWLAALQDSTLGLDLVIQAKPQASRSTFPDLESQIEQAVEALSASLTRSKTSQRIRHPQVPGKGSFR